MGMLACDLSAALPATNTPISPWATVPSTLQPGSALQDIPMQVGYGARSSFYEVYFTDPFNPDSEKLEGGPDVPLVQALGQAQLSIDMAAYSISLRSVRDALLQAQKRGVRVRVVMESDNMLDSVPQALVDAGIPIIGDNNHSNHPGLMHDKFVVIDHSEVWTGAMNFTTAGTYEDNNNLIRIRSTKVAEDYTVEFNEMFERDFFGPDAIAKTPNPYVTIDGVALEVYFSPDDKIVRRIVELLRGAQQSIHFLAYSFTSRDFSDILLQKAGQGLDVSGVMEEQQVKSNKNTAFTAFQQAGLPVYKDGNKGQMHHKVFIIDEKIVIAGSYNFSLSAETQNDENVVIFFDPRIAAQYLAEFNRVDAEAQK
jgi:phosphatidylserine/phosphatidylglycerophosphate/cardiolipin synthase-like enzyme